MSGTPSPPPSKAGCAAKGAASDTITARALVGLSVHTWQGQRPSVRAERLSERTRALRHSSQSCAASTKTKRPRITERRRLRYTCYNTNDRPTRARPRCQRLYSGTSHTHRRLRGCTGWAQCEPAPLVHCHWLCGWLGRAGAARSVPAAAPRAARALPHSADLRFGPSSSRPWYLVLPSENGTYLYLRQGAAKQAGGERRARGRLLVRGRSVARVRSHFIMCLICRFMVRKKRAMK